MIAYLDGYLRDFMFGEREAAPKNPHGRQHPKGKAPGHDIKRAKAVAKRRDANRRARAQRRRNRR